MKRKLESGSTSSSADDSSMLATQDEGILQQTQVVEGIVASVGSELEFTSVATQEFDIQQQQTLDLNLSTQEVDTCMSQSEVTIGELQTQTQSEIVSEKAAKKRKYEGHDSNSFGNYKNYYSYRYNDTNAAKPKEDKCLIDPRLEIISNCLSKYFKNSTTVEPSISLTCIDIGCNQGLFSMQMADFYESQLGLLSGKEISLKSMNAIDIDSLLVRKAKDHVINLKRFNTVEKDQEDDDKLGMSVHTYVTVQRSETPEEKEEKVFVWSNNRKLLKVKTDENSEKFVNICRKSYMNKLIDKVHFKVQNFVDEIVDTKIADLTREKMMEIIEKSTDKTQNTVDIISCLSVTKWIHLNYGDNSVKFLFHKIHKILKPGGIFILEPQHWKSYTKKRELTPKIQENFKSIKFRPTAFHDYLLKEVGFVSSETFFIDDSNNSSSEGNDTGKNKQKKKGFKKRPIVFYYR